MLCPQLTRSQTIAPPSASERMQVPTWITFVTTFSIGYRGRSRSAFIQPRITHKLFLQSVFCNSSSCDEISLRIIQANSDETFPYHARFL